MTRFSPPAAVKSPPRRRQRLAVEVKQIPGCANLWGVFNKRGQQLFLIETHRPHEFDVREYEPRNAQGRGRLFVTFIGPESFHQACGWVATYRPGQLVGELTAV